MTKRQDLCLQRRSRPEQSDQRQANQPANISHQPRASPNSTSLASRIEFPTMTGRSPNFGVDASLFRYPSRRLFRRTSKIEIAANVFPSWSVTIMASGIARFRALALFGRRPPQRVDSIVMPASEKPAQQATPQVGLDMKDAAN
jgi:hypothetical protein